MSKSLKPIENPFPSDLKMVETHAHLDYLKKQSISETIEKSIEMGVDKIVTIAVSPDNQDQVLEIAKEHDQVFCTQGIHPHDARLFAPDIKEVMLANAKDEKCVAIGEIGLDYHYDHSPRDVQKKVFEEQLQMAIDLNLPVIIHTREADEDTEAILKNFNDKLNGVLIHCFTAGMKFAEFALSEDYKLGFNGIITFNAADNVREVLDITPIDKILLETDCPFLTPLPFRGKENAPFFVPFVAKRVCELKEMEANVLLPQIYKNSLKFFSITKEDQ